MSNAVTRAARLGTLLAVATFAAAGAQAPSPAQRDAIKSQCRSDYIAHCASVPPGGAEALQCLQKNMSSLSAGCAGAVKAVQPPAAPKAETAPAAAPVREPAPATARTGPAPAATPAANPAAPTAAPVAAPKAAAAAAPAQQPSNAQISAVRSACRSDYPKVCAGVPTGGAPALQCLQQNKAKLSVACGQAVSAATGGTAAPAASGATAAAPAATAAPAVIVLRPMRPREELMVVRSACGADVRSLCGTVVGGGGRIVQCLASNAASLSPACKDVLTQFAAQ